MRFEGDATKEATTRLRRVEGQVGGIVKMLEEGRDCEDVVQQLAAVTRAVDRGGLKLMASQLRQCLADQNAAALDGYDPQRFERLFLMLA
jgi:DNA-binding FrmR family transcriptional regulator